MDRLVDHLFVFEGEGEIKDFWGTYSEYKEQESSTSKEKKQKTNKKEIQMPKPASTKLSYIEKRELEQLGKDITAAEKRKEEINSLFNNPELPFDEITDLSHELGDLMKQLETKEQRRFELMERA